MSFFNFGRAKKTEIKESNFESSTTSTSSRKTKTSYQVKSSVSSGGRVDGLSYSRSKFSSELPERLPNALPSIKESKASAKVPPQVSAKADGDDNPTGGSFEIDQQFIRSCLQKHNYYREKHNAQPLKINEKLCRFSQEWADNLAKRGRMQHRTDSKYGENLYTKWSSDKNFSVEGSEAVTSWYSEIKDFKFGTDGFSSGTGHFTQVVWKGSTELGVGMARNNKGEVYVVCNYDPPGNFIGQFRENVLPPQK